MRAESSIDSTWESKFEDFSQKVEEDDREKMKKSHRTIQEIKKLNNSSTGRKEEINSREENNQRKISRKFVGTEWYKLPD